MNTQFLYQTSQSVRIAYQPFLSTTRTKHLTSILQDALPYTFLSVPCTSLAIPPEADIVLLSRNGKPFAPAVQRTSTDSKFNKTTRLRDWKESGKEYRRLMDRWREIENEMPVLVPQLRKYFSDRRMRKGNLNVALRVGAYTGEIPDYENIRRLAMRFAQLRRWQLQIYPLVRRTRADIKVKAYDHHKYLHYIKREYVFEAHRDRLDLLRWKLGEQYKGMGLVQYPETSAARPWILLPEDPIGTWGQDFPDRVDELVRLARTRFLLSTEEKEQELTFAALQFIKDNLHELKRRKIPLEDSDAIVKETMETIRTEREQVWGRVKPFVLPRLIGHFGEEYKSPVTRQDFVMYEATDKALVKGGAWRVED
jgi:hypothetical protein